MTVILQACSGRTLLPTHEEEEEEREKSNEREKEGICCSSLRLIYCGWSVSSSNIFIQFFFHWCLPNMLLQQFPCFLIRWSSLFLSDVLFSDIGFDRTVLLTRCDGVLSVPCSLHYFFSLSLCILLMVKRTEALVPLLRTSISRMRPWPINFNWSIGLPSHSRRVTLIFHRFARHSNWVWSIDSLRTTLSCHFPSSSIVPLRCFPVNWKSWPRLTIHLITRNRFASDWPRWTSPMAEHRTSGIQWVCIWNKDGINWAIVPSTMDKRWPMLRRSSTSIFNTKSLSVSRKEFPEETWSACEHVRSICWSHRSSSVSCSIVKNLSRLQFEDVVHEKNYTRDKKEDCDPDRRKERELTAFRWGPVNCLREKEDGMKCLSWLGTGTLWPNWYSLTDLDQWL